MERSGVAASAGAGLAARPSIPRSGTDPRFSANRQENDAPERTADRQRGRRRFLRVAGYRGRHGSAGEGGKTKPALVRSREGRDHRAGIAIGPRSGRKSLLARTLAIP